MDAAAFLADLERNVLPPFLAIRHGGGTMATGGSFVFILSLNATVPTPNLPGDNAAKAGLDNLVRTAAMELGPKGIRLNGLRPGLTRTPGHEAMCDDPAMLSAFLAVTPIGRIGESMDVAQAVRLLAGTGIVMDHRADTHD